MVFDVTINTPHGLYRQTTASIINVVSPDGQRGILPNHMPVVVSLAVGKMTMEEESGRETYAVSGGVLYFRNNRCTILTPAIENVKDIDLERAQRAKERAEELERQRQAALEESGVYGSISYDYGSTGSQMAVVDAAAWTPSTGAGYCAAWVSNVFANAGIGYIYGNACDMYWAYCYSSDLGSIQAGMIIAVPTEPYSYAAILYGHVGIYIGGGLVRHCASGYVLTQSLDSWISEYGVTSTPRWGWLGGITLA